MTSPRQSGSTRTAAENIRFLLDALDERMEHIRFDVLRDLRGTLAAVEIEGALARAESARRSGVAREMKRAFKDLKPYRDVAA